jgi:hypothetical protein
MRWVRRLGGRLAFAAAAVLVVSVVAADAGIVVLWPYVVD